MKIGKLIFLENRSNIEFVFNELERTGIDPIDFMYMFTRIIGENKLEHAFKNRETRNYVYIKTPNKRSVLTV